MNQKNVKSVESVLNTANNTMAAVAVGGVVVDIAAGRVSHIRRQKSALRKQVDGCQQKFPKVFWCGNFCLAAINLALYFLDVYTDVILCITFYRFKHYGWFNIMVICIALPYVVAVVGIMRYLSKEREWNACDFFCCGLIFPVIPISPLFLDILMPFYKGLERCLPNGLVTFMAQYEALRTLGESLLESFPQTILQVYIFFYCDGNEDNCLGITKEAGTALIQSLIISGLSIAFRVAQVAFEMRKEKLGLCGYLKSLIEMGAGLPLRAITNNTITELNIGIKLIPAQVQSLASALKHNTSIIDLNLERAHSGCGIHDEGCEHLSPALAKMTALETLSLLNNQITDKGCEHLAPALAKMTALKELVLSHNQITDKGCEHLSPALAKMTALERLDLRCNQITDKGCEHLSPTLAKMTALKTLYLNNNKITDKCCEHLSPALAKMTALKELGFFFFWDMSKEWDLSSKNLTDEDMLIVAELLKKNTALETLGLSGNQITDKGCEHLAPALAKMTNLKELVLEKNQITDKGCEHLSPALAKMTALKTLYLNNNQITDKGCEHLSPTLAKMTALKTLYLNKNKITDKGCEHLSPALANMTKLKELSLRSNQITDKGCEHLAPALAKMTALNYLNLDFNKITDKGCEHLAPALAKMTALKELNLNYNNYLQYNKITDKGCEHLAPALAKMTRLKTLDLSGNEITDCEHLAPALAKMTALWSLDLEGNQITDKGCEHLAPALAKMTALERLDLRCNQITDKGCEHLAPALAKMTALNYLSLGQLGKKQITDKGKNQMREAWKKAGKQLTDSEYNGLVL